MAREIVTSENKAEYDAKKLGLNKNKYDEMNENFDLKNDSSYIKHHAEKFAENLKSSGFHVDLQHSGSKLGASSYAKIYDPETGRYIVNPVRFSGHSKGPVQHGLVHHVEKPSDTEKYIQMAHEMRKLGPSEHFKRMKEGEEKAAKIRAKKEAKKAEKAK